MSETEARQETPQPRPESGTNAGDDSNASDPGSSDPSSTADTTDTTDAATSGSAEAGDGGDTGGTATGQPRKRRRRGSRGGRRRAKVKSDSDSDSAGGEGDDTPSGGNLDNGRQPVTGTSGASAKAGDRPPDELPDPPGEGRPSVDAAERALVRRPAATSATAATTATTPPKPKIGDTRPAPPAPDSDKPARSRRRRRGGGRSSSGGADGDTARTGTTTTPASDRKPADAGGGARTRGGGTGKDRSDQGAAARASSDEDGSDGRRRRRRRRGGRGKGSDRATDSSQPIEAMLPSGGVALDEETMERRRGRERKGRPVGRYMMAVHVSPKATQIAVLEGRALIEHYVSRPSDDISQIHGNVYLGRVQNVLPGMEAAFVDIGTPKNAVLYRGDIHYDPEDVDRYGGQDLGRQPRIEQMLKAGQTILCQVTKNPIGAKGARLTQEVSLPGRFVVLIPNSSTYGISKRLSDDERKRLRQVLDRVKPAQHGIIVRTAAEGVTSDEIENDVRRLLQQWEQIDRLAKRSKAAKLLYREPDMAVRVIREEFNKDYRGVVIDDRELYEQVRDYVGSISPTLADRVEYYDPSEEKLPLFERHHVHEQLHRALDRKVWLPSGGSLIVEHTEALTVIDVNTGKNVGKSSLEETVFKNNLEAAVEIARQLRLRDIGGIIVVDFIDMERRDNRDEVVKVFREALSRDKTRTQVFEISELGLCEMTRKRIGEGLLESFSAPCPMCEGRGVLFDKELLPD